MPYANCVMLSLNNNPITLEVNNIFESHDNQDRQGKITETSSVVVACVAACPEAKY